MTKIYLKIILLMIVSTMGLQAEDIQSMNLLLMTFPEEILYSIYITIISLVSYLFYDVIGPFQAFLMIFVFGFIMKATRDLSSGNIGDLLSMLYKTPANNVLTKFFLFYVVLHTLLIPINLDIWKVNLDENYNITYVKEYGIVIDGTITPQTMNLSENLLKYLKENDVVKFDVASANLTKIPFITYFPIGLYQKIVYGVPFMETITSGTEYKPSDLSVFGLLINHSSVLKESMENFMLKPSSIVESYLHFLPKLTNIDQPKKNMFNGMDEFTKEILTTLTKEIKSIQGTDLKYNSSTGIEKAIVFNNDKFYSNIYDMIVSINLTTAEMGEDIRKSLIVHNLLSSLGFSSTLLANIDIVSLKYTEDGVQDVNIMNTIIDNEINGLSPFTNLDEEEAAQTMINYLYTSLYQSHKKLSKNFDSKEEFLHYVKSTKNIFSMGGKIWVSKITKYYNDNVQTYLEDTSTNFTLKTDLDQMIFTDNSDNYELVNNVFRHFTEAKAKETDTNGLSIATNRIIKDFKVFLGKSHLQEIKDVATSNEFTTFKENVTLKNLLKIVEKIDGIIRDKQFSIEKISKDRAIVRRVINRLGDIEPLNTSISNSITMGTTNKPLRIGFSNAKATIQNYVDNSYVGVADLGIYSNILDKLFAFKTGTPSIDNNGESEFFSKIYFSSDETILKTQHQLSKDTTVYPTRCSDWTTVQGSNKNIVGKSYFYNYNTLNNSYILTGINHHTTYNLAMDGFFVCKEFSKFKYLEKIETKGNPATDTGISFKKLDYLDRADYLTLDETKVGGLNTSAKLEELVSLDYHISDLNSNSSLIASVDNSVYDLEAKLKAFTLLMMENDDKSNETYFLNDNEYNFAHRNYSVVAYLQQFMTMKDDGKEAELLNSHIISLTEKLLLKVTKPILNGFNHPRNEEDNLNITSMEALSGGALFAYFMSDVAVLKSIFLGIAFNGTVNVAEQTPEFKKKNQEAYEKGREEAIAEATKTQNLSLLGDAKDLLGMDTTSNLNINPIYEEFKPEHNYTRDEGTEKQNSNDIWFIPSTEDFADAAFKLAQKLVVPVIFGLASLYILFILLKIIYFYYKNLSRLLFGTLKQTFSILHEISKIEEWRQLVDILGKFYDETFKKGLLIQSFFVVILLANIFITVFFDFIFENYYYSRFTLGESLTLDATFNAVVIFSLTIIAFLKVLNSFIVDTLLEEKEDINLSKINSNMEKWGTKHKGYVGMGMVDSAATGVVNKGKEVAGNAIDKSTEVLGKGVNKVYGGTSSMTKKGTHNALNKMGIENDIGQEQRQSALKERIGFGKHKGKKIDELPEDYNNYLAENEEGLIQDMQITRDEMEVVKGNKKLSDFEPKNTPSISSQIINKAASKIKEINENRRARRAGKDDEELEKLSDELEKSEETQEETSKKEEPKKSSKDNTYLNEELPF